MTGWDDWKKGFDVWEDATAKMLDSWMRSPFVLGPSGAMLTAAMKAKAASDKATAAWWGSLGLPTKRDQERTLHALSRLESRILDLEDQLADARTELSSDSTTRLSSDSTTRPSSASTTRR